MAKATSPIPQGYHTATPYLVVRNAAEAIEFYKKNFGAQETLRMPSPDGKISHAEIKVGDSIIMLADENDMGVSKSPQTLGGTTAGVMLYLEDVDAVFQRAVDAGSRAVMPPADMFWGDRYGQFIDPFGQAWSVATHTEDLSPEEIEQRAQDFYAQMAQKKSA
jgi:PhnB protein